MNADFYFSSADDTDNTDLFFIFRIGFKHGAAFKVRVHPALSASSAYQFSPLHYYFFVINRSIPFV